MKSQSKYCPLTKVLIKIPVYFPSLPSGCYDRGNMVSSLFGLLKTLYTSPPGRHVHSDTNSASLGNNQPRCNYTRTLFTHIFLSLSIVRYPFIQLSELEPSWRERKCPHFEPEKGIQTFLDWGSGILPLCNSAPHRSFPLAIDNLIYISISLCALRSRLTSIDPDWHDFVRRSIISTIDSAIRQSDLELLRLSVLTDATTQKIAIKKWVAQESGQQVTFRSRFTINRFV